MKGIIATGNLTRMNEGAISGSSCQRKGSDPFLTGGIFVKHHTTKRQHDS
jgi:hypothetical protein